MIRLIRQWPDKHRQRHIGHNIERSVECITHCVHRKWHWSDGWQTVCCMCYAEPIWKAWRDRPAVPDPDDA